MSLFDHERQELVALRETVKWQREENQKLRDEVVRLKGCLIQYQQEVDMREKIEHFKDGHFDVDWS